MLYVCSEFKPVNCLNVWPLDAISQISFSVPKIEIKAFSPSADLLQRIYSSWWGRNQNIQYIISPLLAVGHSLFWPLQA